MPKFQLPTFKFHAIDWPASNHFVLSLSPSILEYTIPRILEYN